MLFDKSFELGKQHKEKLLIFDMDETLISAKFSFNIPKDFAYDFQFDLNGEQVYVRKRPFL